MQGNDADGRPTTPKQARSTRTDGIRWSQSDQERYPNLDLSKEADEDDDEGEITLTFISTPPDHHTEHDGAVDQRQESDPNAGHPRLRPDTSGLDDGGNVWEVTFISPKGQPLWREPTPPQGDDALAGEEADDERG